MTHGIRLLLAIVAVPFSELDAQNVDSLARVLQSASLQARSAALSAIVRLGPTAVKRAGPAIIAQLEREGLGTAVTIKSGAPDHVWAEYTIELTRAAISLGDPRAVRGVALLGIQTSRAAQEFVIAQGEAGLAALEEAWTLRESAREGIMETWGVVLAHGARPVAGRDRSRIIRHLLSPQDTFPIALITLTRKSGLTVLSPLLRTMAAQSDPRSMRHSWLLREAERLDTLAAAKAAPALVDDLTSVSLALCEGAADARAEACGAISAHLQNAAAQLAAGRSSDARRALQEVADRVELARRQEVFSGRESGVLAGNVTRLTGRLPQE